MYNSSQDYIQLEIFIYYTLDATGFQDNYMNTTENDKLKTPDKKIIYKGIWDLEGKS